MPETQPSELNRIRSISPKDFDRCVAVLTPLAALSGFAVFGVRGAGFALIAACIVGLFLRLQNQAAALPPELNRLAVQSKISYPNYFLVCAGTSLLIIGLKDGMSDSIMQFLALWSLFICLMSPVVHFSAKQWRGIAITGVVISLGYIASFSQYLFRNLPFFGNSAQATPASGAFMFVLIASGSLALLTCLLVGAGKLTKKLRSKTERHAGAAQGWMQNLTSFFGRATRQTVAELPVYVFVAWYLAIVYGLVIPAGSVGDMFANTFMASARDANISSYSKEHRIRPHITENTRIVRNPNADPFVDGFDDAPRPSNFIDEPVPMVFEDGTMPLPPVIAYAEPTSVWHGLVGLPPVHPENAIDDSNEATATALVVKAIITLGFLVLPFSLIMRGAAFYASLVRRCIGATGNLRLSESALAAMRDTGDKLRLKYESRFLAQASRTFWWLLFWYAVVFSLVAFAGGGFGACIRNWIDASIVSAGLRNITTEFNLNMRYFMAALLAMYACGPLAVTGCVFLPHRSGRQIVVTEEGISAPDGPFLQMWLRTFRLYVDIKAVTLRGKLRPDVEHAKDKRRIKLHFRTGGFLSFRVMDMPPEDLRLLLERIDEHAEDCALSPAAVDLRVSLSKGSQAKSENEKSANRGKFKSSIFVPFVGGEKIESHNLRIVKVLGNKPLSAVYLVRMDSGKLAVLKQLVMPKDDEVSREHLRIFQRECELMRELNHAGIAGVIDAFNDGNNHFLLLEHFKGHDLKTVVDSYGARTVEEVANWALSLCDVLEYLHARGVIHRDVTPENIVVGEHEGVRLIDFGAAHQFIEGITGTLIGKQSYVAPEQLRGKASKRSDIYSLGVTMNFLLTAMEPVALMQCDPDLGDSKSAKLMRSLIKTMTDFEEERRPESIQEVRRILNSVLNKQVAAAASSGKVEAALAATIDEVREPQVEAQPEAKVEPELNVESEKKPESETRSEPNVKGESESNVENDEERLVVRTIKLMADVLPETIKVETKQKKKLKVKKQVNPEKQ